MKTCFKCGESKPLAAFYKHPAMADGHLGKRGSRNNDLRYPHKKKASTAVGNALRDGRLFRKPCEVCGSLKVQAHHDDYSKPLDVRWLCVAHHAEHHRTMREMERQRTKQVA